MPTIGIIGAGQIGRAIASTLAKHGIPAILANSRGPESLADAVGTLSPTITAGTREEAASREIVFVAVNWSKLPAALAGLPDFGGRIVVDANNHARFRRIDILSRNANQTAAEGLLAGERVVVEGAGFLGDNDAVRVVAAKR